MAASDASDTIKYAVMFSGRGERKSDELITVHTDTAHVVNG